MRPRWTVAAKAALCLAAAATGDFSVTVAAIYLLLRVLGKYWGGPELRNPSRSSDPASVRVVGWIWRFEFGAAVAVATARVIGSALVGIGNADVIMVGALFIVLATPGPRDRLRRRLVGLRRQRRWQACVGRVIPAPATPTVTATGEGPEGEWAQVRVGAGSTAAELVARSEALAACLAVSTVRVERHRDNAGWALIQAMKSDPLARPAPQWPWLELCETSVWKPVPVGIDESGAEVTVTLAEHNLLLGGEPGAGKSVALSQLVAAAALDASCGLWLVDGKLVELAAWRPSANGWAGSQGVEAVALLRRVREIMDARYAELLGAGRRKIGPDQSLQVVVVDELAQYLTDPDKHVRDAFADVLRDLVSRGRAAGIVVIAATQKPSSDVVPTSLRDLFGFRWALRCTTNAASDTILGSGWAAQGVSSATVAPQSRGVGWLLHESGTPLRLRAHYLDDSAITALAARAARTRSETNPACDGR